MKVRINKLISDAGLGSRREAEQYIEDGRITINGHRASLADTVIESDDVRLDGIDLPIKDLLRDLASERAYDERIRSSRAVQAPRNGKRETRATLQRAAAAPKSAALRKPTSSANPQKSRGGRR